MQSVTSRLKTSQYQEFSYYFESFGFEKSLSHVLKKCLGLSLGLDHQFVQGPETKLYNLHWLEDFVDPQQNLSCPSLLGSEDDCNARFE